MENMAYFLLVTFTVDNFYYKCLISIFHSALCICHYICMYIFIHVVCHASYVQLNNRDPQPVNDIQEILVDPIRSDFLKYRSDQIFDPIRSDLQSKFRTFPFGFTPNTIICLIFADPMSFPAAHPTPQKSNVRHPPCNFLCKCKIHIMKALTYSATKAAIIQV